MKAVTALEAWEMLNSNKNAYLIDVRTDQEWRNIGTPALPEEKRVIRLSSHIKPFMEQNPDFIKKLEKLVPKDSKLFFMCKTNGRSKAALELAEKNSFKDCVVIIDGFEGNQSGSGWLKSNLPSAKI